MRDFLITRVTGILLCILGVGGVIFITKYDALVHRTFNMGINAYAGIVLCLGLLALGIVHISSWDNF